MIKFFISDVDGTLTDGKVSYNFPDKSVAISYSKIDGEGFARLREHGITPIWITTEQKDSPHEDRAKDLGINYFFKVEDKFAFIDEFLKERDYTWDDVAYIGDDYSDLRCLISSKYAFIPKNSRADKFFQKEPSPFIVTGSEGGEGCVRDAIEFILEL